MTKRVCVWGVAIFKEKIQISDNETKTVRWHAPIRLDDRSELISQIQLQGADKIFLTGSKKEAEELAKFWNECARKNGDYRW
jgi:hypothetical protein